MQVYPPSLVIAPIDERTGKTDAHALRDACLENARAASEATMKSTNTMWNFMICDKIMLLLVGIEIK